MNQLMQEMKRRFVIAGIILAIVVPLGTWMVLSGLPENRVMFGVAGVSFLGAIGSLLFLDRLRSQERHV